MERTGLPVPSDLASVCSSESWEQWQLLTRAAVRPNGAGHARPGSGGSQL